MVSSGQDGSARKPATSSGALAAVVLVAASAAPRRGAAGSQTRRSRGSRGSPRSRARGRGGAAAGRGSPRACPRKPRRIVPSRPSRTRRCRLLQLADDGLDVRQAEAHLLELADPANAHERFVTVKSEPPLRPPGRAQRGRALRRGESRGSSCLIRVRGHPLASTHRPRSGSSSAPRSTRPASSVTQRRLGPGRGVAGCGRHGGAIHTLTLRIEFWCKARRAIRQAVTDGRVSRPRRPRPASRRERGQCQCRHSRRKLGRASSRLASTGQSDGPRGVTAP